jgi:SNF2 family DNA or RNA helicase
VQSNFTLRDYQETTVQYGIQNPYCILSLEQGLGKTICSLEIGTRTNSKMLVICPAYLINNWIDEIRKFYPGKIVTAFKAGKDFYPIWDTDIVVTSYGLIHHGEFLFEWADTVIIDEVHKIKSSSAKITTIIHKFIYENSIERCLLLSGTPMQNRIPELYSLICIINYNPKLKDSPFLKQFPTETDFSDRFAHKKEMSVKTKRGFTKKFYKYYGMKNVAELKNWLRLGYIRFEAKDCLDLPPAIYKDIMISDSDNDKLLEAFTSVFDKEGNDSVMPDIKAMAALEKVPFTVEYVKGLLEEGIEKVIIYTDHVDSCIELAKKLGASPIHGQIGMEIRRVIANNFIYGTTKVLVATIGAFSTGVTLTVAQHMVFNDFPWVPGQLAQAEKRISRIGQTGTCVYHRIIGSPQDLKILKTIVEKNIVIRSVL